VSYKQRRSGPLAGGISEEQRERIMEMVENQADVMFIAILIIKNYGFDTCDTFVK